MKVLRLLRPRAKKGLIALALSALLLCVVGGGAYAALGGASRLQTASDIELQRGLVGWWKLDGNGKDSTPFGRNGTVYGTTNVADREGKSGAAKSFNGSTDAITVSNFDSTVLSPSSYSASWSMSIWAKTVTFKSEDDVLLGKAGYNGGITTAVGANGYWFSIWDATGNSHVIQWLPSNPTTTWHLLTATYSNGAMTLYGDGQLIGTNSVPSMTTYGNALGIGHNGGGGYAYTGSLDDARVYNRVLSAAEAKALYDQYDPGIVAASGENGLVGWWKLNGDAMDSTPYGNNGAITGSSFVADRENRANGAYKFISSSTKIQIPYSAAFNPTTALTVGAWVNLGSYGTGVQRIVANLDTGGYGLYITGSAASDPCGVSNLCFRVNISGTYRLVSIPLTSLTGGVWYYIAGTYDGSSLKLYVNNSMVTSASFPGTITTNTSALCIGSAPSGASCSSNFLNNVSVDDVRVYNRALSLSEITNLYSSYDSQINIAANPTNNISTGNINAGLVGYWPFNGNAKDATPYGNNGTVNGATLAPDRKGRGNSAYSFGNSGIYINIGNPPTYATLGTSGFTYSVWLMRTTTSTYQWPIVMGASNSHSYYAIRSQSYGDYISFEYGTSPYDGANGHFNNLGAAGNLPVNEWHLFTFTYDGSTLKYYRDGAMVSSMGSITMNPTFNNLAFTDNTADFNGSMDDARVYNRALSAVEVQTLYNSYN